MIEHGPFHSSLDINPNCTGLFRSMRILGGGGGGGVGISADRRKIWHAPQKLCKEKDLGCVFSQKLHILLLMIIYALFLLITL